MQGMFSTSQERHGVFKGNGVGKDGGSGQGMFSTSQEYLLVYSSWFDPKKTTVNIISSEQLIEKVGTIPRQPYVFETGIQLAVRK